MQKKTLVLAIGAALLIPFAVHAQKGGSRGDRASEPDSVVEMYGKLYPEFVFPDGKGATSAGTPTCTICNSATGTNAFVRKTEIESSNSRLGFRGHEKLSPEMKAIWQLETQFLLDQNTTGFVQRDS